MNKIKKLTTEPYKGVRDFYPEEMFLLNYLFKKMRGVAERFGYVEYGASVLEPAELYQAKSGEEIFNEQTYTFTDRGGRKVSLRPEMTPTLARMTARRRQELAFPLRWYSLPNLFRYERTQKGRLREHFQFNLDLLGAGGQEAELEVLTVAAELMKEFGAEPADFEIRLNDRRLINDLFDQFQIPDQNWGRLSQVIDKRQKISAETFEAALETFLGKSAGKFLELLDSNQKLVAFLGEERPAVKALVNLIEALDRRGLKNIRFSPALVRGFDYYTGTVFEIYDRNPENRRSLFGGGRYDELLQIFGKGKLPAVGFGLGDVTLLEFLKARNKLPAYRSSTDLYLCILGQNGLEAADRLAGQLRSEGVRVALDWSRRKVADRIKTAVKQKIPYLTCFGQAEIESSRLKIKNLASGQETTMTESEFAAMIKKEKKERDDC